eukprot:2980261-Karenia_brevis.AAC.2
MENANNPLAHHQKWRSDCKLPLGDGGVIQHEAWCRVLYTLLTYDQVDIHNLAGAELVARQIQLLEHKYSDRMPGASDSADSNSLLFAGSLGTRGNVCVSPLLSEWIAEESRKEAAVLKEQRKAHEERALARKAPKGKEDK